MVNVGGRSKGCSTCRRRRIKCDETRPICKRCQRCNFECDGAKDFTFVEGKIVSSRRGEKRAVVPTARNTQQAEFSGSEIPLSPSLKGSEFEIYVCYAHKHFTRGGPIHRALHKIQLGDITPPGASPTNVDGPIFPQAILSLAIIYFGAQHRQASISDQGYKMHGVALTKLNQALSDPKCYIRHDVVLSVATLAILEALVPTGPRSYLQHMLGMERLLGLRDPREHCSVESTELYKAVRHMMLFSSLRTGRASILARPEWKKALRRSCSEKELPEQDLYDVLADCTVLVAVRDEMSAYRESDLTPQYDELKRKAQTLLNHLSDWKKRWDSDKRNSCFETSPAALQPMMEGSWGHDSPSFLTVFEFTNAASGIMFMLYNTALIYVLQVLASLSVEKLGTRADQSSMRPAIHEIRSLDDLWEHTRDEYAVVEWLAALEVYRCIPYYLSRKATLDAEPSPTVHWALTTAWKTLRGVESAEGRWLMDLLTTKAPKLVSRGLWAS